MRKGKIHGKIIVTSIFVSNTIFDRFYFSTPEIMFTAEQQLEAADGIEDTPFVTVKVTLDENSQAVVEAFQVWF